MIDCNKCKDYRKCLGKEWYSYGEVRWCPFQCLWIIEHLDLIIIGKWPPSPEGSTYTDSSIKRSVPLSYASFEKPCDIVAELEVRLRKTGVDGKLLIAEVQAGKTFELSKEAQTALMYIKGWRRKRLTYSNWKKQRTYLGKNTTKK